MAVPNKIFLAGSTGLVGTHLIHHLLDMYPGIYIKAAYNRTTPFMEHERVHYVQVDLLDRSTDYGDLLEGCPWAIMAAASTGGAGAAQSSPQRQMTDNLVMDALMLEGLYSAGVKRIIYLSSATVYQAFDGYIKEEQLDFNEDPHFSYLGVGWAKRSAEKFCRFWHEKYGIEIIIARCANIYGPYARFDPQKSNFIPALIRKAVSKMEPFEVWGSPDVARDVIYAEDFAEAVILLLSQEDIKFDIFNLGYGDIVTVGEVVDAALLAADHKPNAVKYSENSPQTIGFRALDCNKIKSTVNWKPRHSITRGIKKTTLWWEQNMETWTR
ncbi:NAD-dependent epimerase/dehydratase family protein [Desulfospira joergensenii]|uniref:NAD-dependent epimerase/dehydratase family protein n=1 Tax=Desulfospira joergensenii TaxID=53329 RepID=UPI000424D619|nr:NAD(P)-dependent oxidoreductase [Desulfospira joergensenii]